MFRVHWSPVKLVVSVFHTVGNTVEMWESVNLNGVRRIRINGRPAVTRTGQPSIHLCPGK